MTLKPSRIFQAARLFHRQGATGYALKLVSQLSPKTPEEFRIAGNIYLDSYEYTDALKCFQGYFESKPDPAEAKQVRIALCDAWCGLERFSDALRELRNIRPDSADRTLKGVLLRAEGGCLARRGHAEEACPVLMRAFDFFSREEQTPEMALVHQWLGYAKAAMQRDEGVDPEIEAHFLKATLFLRKSGTSPESWLECWYRMHEMGYLGEGQRIQMSVYPGLPTRFVGRPGFLDRVLVGNPSAPIRIDPYRNEYEWNGERRTEIPSELKLLACLRLAGEWGVSLARVKTVLRPDLGVDDIAFFGKMEPTVFELLERLEKNYGVGIGLENGVLRLSAASRNAIGVEYSRSKHFGLGLDPRVKDHRV